MNARFTFADGAASHSFEPVAIVSRSGVDESVHFGAAVAIDAAGEVVFAVGDADLAIYPRSSTKPLQASALLALGWRPTSAQLALAGASHAGTPRHLDVVRSTLADAGLDERALANTPTLPLDVAAAHAVLAAGGAASSLLQNCSGKHAAMLATCVVNGWPTADYLHPDHPLQLAITEHIDGLVGGTVHIGVDGCGAPAHMFALSALARVFGRLAAAESAVAVAMRDHPDLVGGVGRDVTRLMDAVPGLFAKDGAEGVFAAALPDGRCAAVKVADGASRASGVVIAATLRTLGDDVAALLDVVGDPVLGHGQPVGAVRPAQVFDRGD